MSTPLSARGAMAVSAGLLSSLLASACGSSPEIENPPLPPANEAASIQSVSPRAAGPDGRVTLRGTGFTPGAAVEVGLGLPESEYDVIARTTANPAGEVATTVGVPDWVQRGEGYVFVLAGETGRKAVSDLFHVTTAEGLVRIEGRMTDEGVECPAMRTLLTNELYTLAGDTDGFAAGERVVVEGEIAEVSICQQGTTIAVEEIRAR